MSHATNRRPHWQRAALAGRGLDLQGWQRETDVCVDTLSGELFRLRARLEGLFAVIAAAGGLPREPSDPAREVDDIEAWLHGQRL